MYFVLWMRKNKYQRSCVTDSAIGCKELKLCVSSVRVCKTYTCTESIVSPAVAARIPDVNLTVVSSVQNLLVKLEEGAETQRQGRKRFSSVSPFECLVFQLEYGTCRQKCFRSTGWFCLAPTSTGVKWSALRKAYTQKLCVAYSEYISSFEKSILYFCFIVIFVTLYLVQSLGTYLSDGDTSLV